MWNFLLLQRFSKPLEGKSDWDMLFHIMCYPQFPDDMGRVKLETRTKTSASREATRVISFSLFFSFFSFCRFAPPRTNQFGVESSSDSVNKNWAVWAVRERFNDLWANHVMWGGLYSLRFLCVVFVIVCRIFPLKYEVSRVRCFCPVHSSFTSFVRH